MSDLEKNTVWRMKDLEKLIEEWASAEFVWTMCWVNLSSSEKLVVEKSNVLDNKLQELEWEIYTFKSEWESKKDPIVK